MNIKSLIKVSALFVFGLGPLVVTNIAVAACTYSEAMMAFKHGNSVRGTALMIMAANDGDARAAHYLVKVDDESVDADMKLLIVADNIAASVARSTPLLWQRVD